MTKEQAQKHGNVIKWFIDNSDKGVYELTSIGWKLTDEPNFYPADKYVQNDRYAEFRKALVDGKTIQVNDFEEWADSSFLYTMMIIVSFMSILILFGLLIEIFITWELSAMKLREIISTLFLPTIIYLLYKKDIK